MIVTPERVAGVTQATRTLRPRVPKEIRITLTVCGCYRQEKLAFITERARRTASILGITSIELTSFAVTAMITGKPEVVACYKQRDVAEEKLAQLEAQTPFISRPCHSFDIQM